MKKTFKLILAILLTVSLLTSCSNSSSADTGSSSGPENSSSVSSDDPTTSDNSDNGNNPAENEPAPVIDDDVSQGTYADGSELSFDEFAFYYEVYEQGIPEGAYYPETQYAAGSWRYELFVYEQGSYNVSYLELGYADLDIEERSKTATLTLHPRIGNDGYESYPVTDEGVGYEPFDGGLDEYSGLILNGNGLDLYLSYYYAYEGREYIIGSLFKSSDLFAGLLMIRGQD
ncbi:MAG: hypothetical protein J5796_03860 [Erysipelotrichaceae bacterium]|nr:hypothetical protein [Erysipelotrichaceae bacterium]